MAESLPPLASVRAFEAVARLLSFTEAGNELGLTQAAVSYQIKLLEERLGTALFHRVGRRIELTEQGQRLAPAIFRAFEAMRAGFAALRTDSGAVLTISCTNSVAHLWLAPRIGKFQMREPHLAVRIHNSDRIADFVNDNIDIAIRGGDGRWPGLDAELLTHIRIAPVCSPGFLADHGPFSAPADLLRLPRMSPEDYWWGVWFDAMGVEPGPRQGPPAIALDSQVLEGRAAMAGQGVAIVNVAFWRSEIDGGALVEPIPSEVIEPMRYWLAYPPATRNLPKIKAFRDWVREEFAEERRKDPEGRFFPRG